MTPTLAVTLLAAAVVAGCGTPPAAVLYVANRGSDDVSAYAIELGSGRVTPISGSPFRAGSAPGAIVTDREGRFVFVANNFSQEVSAYAVRSSGALDTVAGAPFLTPAFPLSVAVDPSGRFVHVFSAGMPRELPDGAGRVATYAVDPASGKLTPRAGDVPVGAAPVAAAVTSDGYVSVANMLSHDISVYAADPTSGALAPMTGSPFPAYRVRLGGGTMGTFGGTPIPGPTIEVAHWPASVAVARSGLVYVVAHTLALPMPVAVVRPGAAGDAPGGTPPTAMSSVSAYALNRASGTLTAVPGSPWPAGRRPVAVALTPSGRFAYVANLESDDISAFGIDSATGALTEAPGSPFKAGLRPAAVAVDASGRFVYVANSGSNDLSAFTIDDATGALRPLAESPVKTGAEPVALAIADRSGRRR